MENIQEYQLLEYQRLTGEKLKLHNHEIYVVYQRNKAEYGTLGIDYGKKNRDCI